MANFDLIVAIAAVYGVRTSTSIEQVVASITIDVIGSITANNVIVFSEASHDEIGKARKLAEIDNVTIRGSSHCDRSRLAEQNLSLGICQFSEPATVSGQRDV